MHPKFVLSWMKKTGGGVLRSGGDFNQRRQDGHKEYMLCSSCEGIFGKLETYFSKQIFFPVVNDQVGQFTYDERLFKFVVSILWRYLHFEFLETEKETFSHPFIVSAEQEWRQYLLNNVHPDHFTSLHLLPKNFLLNQTGLTDHQLIRLVHYMARNSDAVVTDNCLNYSIGFIKLPRFPFIIPLAGFNQNLMSATSIQLEGGIFIDDQATLDDALIVELIMGRVRQTQTGLEGMSDVQKQKIAAVIKNQWDTLKDKDVGKVMELAAKLIKKNQ
jgi:hypothetical protein